MAGIYIHIPFCKQACHYCNFHFSTSLKYKSQMVQAIIKELHLKKDYLQGESVESIYFGGGTPSLLEKEELEELFNTINNLHQVSPDAEITLEANPDDLSQDYLNDLASTSVNRLSIGIQSFHEDDLRFMNRAHNAQQAHDCLIWAQQAGFKNITADLIYGSPSTTDAQWAKNISTLLDFNIPHISCYCLTVEPGTALDHFVKKGKAKPVDEQKANQQFLYLMEQMDLAGFQHYEISNFAKLGCIAKHNSSYWKEVPYLGVGPSAHSFNGQSRQWNIAHNAKYLNAIKDGKDYYEQEILSANDQYNEYVLTSLRTIWGCKISRIKEMGDKYATYFTDNITPFLQKNEVLESSGVYRLSQQGKLLADHISSSLFFV